MLNLTELPVNETAIIAEQTMDELPDKLIDFGCYPGNLITVINFAPFNGPVYIKIQESFVAIRRETAKRIKVLTMSPVAEGSVEKV